MTPALSIAEPPATSTRHVVALRDVGMPFGERGVIDHVSLAVAPQERLAITGPVVSILKLCFLIQAALVMSALAQTPSEQNSALASQAKQVHGLAVPVPKEIFRSLDQFRDANWPVS